MPTESFEQDSNPFGNLIRTAIGLAPLAGAGYAAYNKMRTNGPVNPAISFGVGGGNLISVASQTGKELKISTGKSRKADLDRIKLVADEILKADSLQKMFSSVEEQRVMVQSLLDTLSDPASGLAQDVLLSYREKLMDLATNSPDSDELRDSIKAVVKAVDTQGTENTRVRLAKNLREYRKLGPNLVPPSTALTADKSYIDLDFSGMKGRVNRDEMRVIKSRHRKLVEALGSGGGKVELVGKEFDGAFQVYARVSHGSRFAAHLPLHTGKTKSGLRVVFSNEGLTTAYAAPAQFLSGKKLASLGTDLATKAASAEVAMEDVWLDEYIGGLRNFGGRVSHYSNKAFGASQRQHLTALPKDVYSASRPGYTSHALNSIVQSQNYATVVGLQGDAKEQLDTMIRLGSAAGYEANAPGYQVLVRGLDNEPIGRIGLAHGSALESLRGVQTADRLYYPVQSRLEQVFGRTAQFVGSTPERMGVGDIFSAGATNTGSSSVVHMTGQNIEWAQALTGATNKAMVLVSDKNHPMYKSLDGTGAALHAGQDTVVDAWQKPILDPGTHNMMSSRLFKHIREKYKPGEDFVVTKQMLKEHGTFWGFGGNGPQHIRIDPRMEEMRLSYTVSESSGKTTINLHGLPKRRMESYKGFSLAHKGMFQQVGKRKLAKNLRSLGINAEQRKRLGLKLEHTAVAASDMLKKAPGFLEHQMAGAYAFISGDTDYLSTIRQGGAAHGLTLPGHKLGKTYGGVVQALATGLKNNKVKANDIGLVLSGAWNHAPDYVSHSDADLLADPTLASRGFRITQQEQESAIRKAFGDAGHGTDVIDQVMQGVRGPATLFPSSVVQGMGPGDYGVGVGSVEPRFMQMLQHRLQNMGLTTLQSAKVMADIYGRKLGGANNLKAAQGMLKFLESVGGSQGLATGVQQLLGDVPEYGLGDLAKINSQEFTEFLADHPKGFNLNLTSGADTPARSAIASAAGDIVHQGNIFFPGIEMTEAMRDVHIKNTGDFDTVVHGEWMENASGFLKNIAGISTQTVGASEAAKEAIGTFVKRGREMATKTIHNIDRGKIRGMTTLVAQPLVLGENVSFEKSSRHRLAKAITKKTRGRAVFFDSHGFMSQLSEYMGTKEGNRKDAARRAEMFFLSSEEALATGRVGKAKGVFQIGQRHPEMSMGNIFDAQVYLHPGELAKPNEYLNRFLSGDAGKGWSDAGVREFKDLLGESADVRHAFFSDFVRDIDSLAPDGGGSVFLPQGYASVKLSNGAKSNLGIDIGHTSAAGGDFDGDPFMFTTLNRENTKLLLGRQRADAMKEWSGLESSYKIKKQIFTEEAKKGLKSQGGQVLDLEASIRQGLLSEQAAKSSVGSLNTQLDKIRLSLLDMTLTSKAGREEVGEALAFLAVIQEHASVKGKKLPIFKPFSDLLGTGIKRGFEDSDWGALERTLAEDLFPTSNLLTSGVMIDSVDDPMNILSNLAGTKVDIATPLATIKAAVARSSVTGISDAVTSTWTTLGLASADPERRERMMTHLLSGQTQASAVLLGATEDAGQATKQVLAKGQHTLQNMGNYLSGLDTKTTGLIAGGLMAAMAAMALVGQRGYSDQTLTMPGEISGNLVDKQIGAGSLLGPGGKNYPQATPQQAGTTYMQGRSSYGIRGQLRSQSDINSATSYMSTMSGGNMRGSVSIQDDRRPLTANYIDRLMGTY